MKSLAILVVVGCCVLVGCRELAIDQAQDSSSTPSLEGSAGGGGGNSGGYQRGGGGFGGHGFGGDPRAGRRQDRPQRPELEE